MSALRLLRRASPPAGTGRRKQQRHGYPIQ